MSLEAKLEQMKQRLRECHAILHGPLSTDISTYSPYRRSSHRSIRHDRHHSQRHKRYRYDFEDDQPKKKSKSIKQWEAELERYSRYLPSESPSPEKQKRKHRDITSPDQEESDWHINKRTYASLITLSSDSDSTDSSSSSSGTQALSSLLSKLQDKQTKSPKRKQISSKTPHKHKQQKGSPKQQNSTPKLDKQAPTSPKQQNSTPKQASSPSPKQVKTSLHNNSTDVDGILALLEEETKGMSDSGNESSGNIDEILSKFTTEDE